MNIRAKAYLNAISTLSILLLVEYLVYQMSQYFGLSWVLFIIAPLIFLGAIFFWLHRVTGIRCYSCNNPYGVNIGLGGWPSIPDKCLNCGVNG